MRFLFWRLEKLQSREHIRSYSEMLTAFTLDSGQLSEEEA